MRDLSVVSTALLDVLKERAMGKENAVTIGKLQYLVYERTGTKYMRREIEQATEEIRDTGLYPLCSSVSAPMGLYIAQNPDELLPYYRQIESRVRKMCIRRSLLRKCSINLWGIKPSRQLSIFDAGAT